MPTARHVTLVTVLVAVVLLATGVVSPAEAAKRRTLDLCTLVPGSVLENHITGTLGAPHDLSREPMAAGCHFPAAAIGSTDIGLYASTNVPEGIKKSYGGSFFATLDNFARVYGTTLPVTCVGTNAYSAFTPGHLAQGALLVLDGPQRAVLIVLVGHYVTAANSVNQGREIASLLLNKIH